MAAPAAYAGARRRPARDNGGIREWRGRAAELAAAGPRTSIGLFAAFADSRVALHHGQHDQAAAALAGLGIGERPWYDNTRHEDYDAYAWALAAETAVIAGLPDAAHRLAPAARGRPGKPLGRRLPRPGQRPTARCRAAPEESRPAGAHRSRLEKACTPLLIPERAAQGHAELEALGRPRAPPGTGRDLPAG